MYNNVYVMLAAHIGKINVYITTCNIKYGMHRLKLNRVRVCTYVCMDVAIVCMIHARMCVCLSIFLWALLPDLCYPVLMMMMIRTAAAACQ